MDTPPIVPTPPLATLDPLTALKPLVYYYSAKRQIRDLVSRGSSLSDPVPVFLTFELAMNGISIDEDGRVHQFSPILWTALKARGRVRAKVMALVVGVIKHEHICENDPHLPSDLNRALAIVERSGDTTCARLLEGMGATQEGTSGVENRV